VSNHLSLDAQFIQIDLVFGDNGDILRRKMTKEIVRNFLLNGFQFQGSQMIAFMDSFEKLNQIIFTNVCCPVETVRITREL